MDAQLTEKLLQGGLSRSEGDLGHQAGGGQSQRVNRRRSSKNGSSERLGPALEDAVARISQGEKQRGRSKRQPDPALLRKFLRRLAVALHTYGNSAPRTEYLIDRASERLGVKTSIAVFPSLILLSFLPPDHNPANAETHVLSVTADLDVNKLGRADELASRVGVEHVPLLVSYWRLRSIATAPPQFGAKWVVPCYAISSAASAILFFQGSLMDGLFSTFLGLCVGLLNELPPRSNIFASISAFLSALLVSFGATLLDVYMKGVCYIALTLGSITWLLPGLSLTVAVTELAAGSQVSGTSRFVSALLTTLQLGVGLALGENLVWWTKHVPSEHCPSSSLSPWWNILWFALYTSASNILLNARWDQWPGLAIVAGIGYAVSYFAELVVLNSAATVLAAFVIGITGTLYARFSGQLPITLTLSAILVLVPGGIGLRGAAAMARGDAIAGLQLTIEMVVVSLCITIGLLVARLVLPSGLFGKYIKEVKDASSTLASDMEEDEDTEIETDEDDDMPI